MTIKGLVSGEKGRELRVKKWRERDGRQAGLRKTYFKTPLRPKHR